MTRRPAPYPVVAVAAIVFDDDDRVLLVERGRAPGVGLWSVPGGRVELGESLAAALCREVHEETGLTVEPGRLVEVFERITIDDGDTWHHVILDYLARATGGALAPGDDVRAARWVTAGELDALPLTDGLTAVIERARRLRAAPAGSPAGAM